MPCLSDAARSKSGLPAFRPLGQVPVSQKNDSKLNDFPRSRGEVGQGIGTFFGN